jgi:hypothetical protein
MLHLRKLRFSMTDPIIQNYEFRIIFLSLVSLSPYEMLHLRKLRFSMTDPIIQNYFFLSRFSFSL